MRITELAVAVVSVVPTHPGRSAIDPWDDGTAHNQQLTEARDYLAARGIAAETIRPIGDPAHAIESVAQAGDYDTIVIGSRGLGAASRVLSKSVSEHVATLKPPAPDAPAYDAIEVEWDLTARNGR